MSEAKATHTPRQSTYWLIVKDGGCGVEVLTVTARNSKALPVFSFAREAEVFLWLLKGAESGWRIRDCEAEELASVLFGSCAGVRSVALDPSAGMVTDEAIDLVSMSWDAFVETLMPTQAKEEVSTTNKRGVLRRGSGLPSSSAVEMR